MYQKLLGYLKEKPSLYAPSTAPFWDDSHISKNMLAAHLAVDVESASRKYDSIIKSTQWIAESYRLAPRTSLLDLGCGPGLYAELFHKSGFSVTGIDFSKRSIQHATESAKNANLPIHYLYKNYLDIDYKDTFDIVTLIYCDFGVLPKSARQMLLKKIKTALKDGGVLILDGWAKGYAFSEGRTIEYCEEGFWSANPHMCVQSNYYYPNSHNFLEQYIIVTENDCQCYNNWNQIYTAKTLAAELQDAGLADIAFYDDVTGKAYTGACDTICAVARNSI